MLEITVFWLLVIGLYSAGEYITEKIQYMQGKRMNATWGFPFHKYGK
jgi:hypothetical protein